jgi:hypothetical protein
LASHGGPLIMQNRARPPAGLRLGSRRRLGGVDGADRWAAGGVVVRVARQRPVAAARPGVGPRRHRCPFSRRSWPPARPLSIQIHPPAEMAGAQYAVQEADPNAPRLLSDPYRQGRDPHRPRAVRDPGGVPGPEAQRGRCSATSAPGCRRRPTRWPPVTSVRASARC